MASGLDERELGEPIAIRELVNSNTGDGVTVRIWAPFRAGDDVWACPFQIVGFGDGRIDRAIGSDSVQALQMSFQGIRARLRPGETGIHWGDSTIGDAGFPLTVDYSLGADFYYYLCDVMYREAIPNPDDYADSKRVRRERIAAWKASKAGEEPK